MKEEATLLKSSKEILTELFDEFNATPPSSPVQDLSNSEPVETRSVKKKKKKEKKSKREKRKHDDRKKCKKKKKKRRRSKSSSSNDEETHKKRSSRKKLLDKSIKLENCDGKETPRIKTEITSTFETLGVKQETDQNCSNWPNEGAASFVRDLPKSPSISTVLPDLIPNEKNESIIPNAAIPVDDHASQVSKTISVFDEITSESKGKVSADLFSTSIEKPKVSIKISNLKNSTILETAEEVAKQKAERYEEGELTESSSDSNNSSDENKADHDKIDDSKDKKKDYSERRKRHKHHKSHKRKKRSKSPVRIVRRVIRKSRSRSRSRGRKSDKEDVKVECRNPDSKERRSRSGSWSRSSRFDKEEIRIECRREGSKEKGKSSARDKESRSDKSDSVKDGKSHRDSRKDGKRHRERSRDKSADRTVDKSRNRSRDKSRERRKARSKSPLELPSMMISKKTKRSRSRSRTRGLEIDKKKLLEIARKNALSMMKQGIATDQGKVATLTAGGKTVDELTDFCKLLSQKEGADEIESFSPLSNSSDSEGEKPFHHPFLIKDRPTNIVMNIRNCASLPVKTHQEKTAENAQQLRIQFPVSSGQQHRKTESEWVPVSPKKDEVKQPPVKPQIEKPKKPPQILAIEPPPPPPPELTNVFPSVEEKYDVGEMVGMRLNAVKRLQDNPSDLAAHQLLREAEEKMSRWRDSQMQPGLFTGSTNVRLLTPAELAAGAQAWARKDQLMSAQPVTSGMGMSLLQKMGWKPGEGLGKNHEGTLEPLSLPVKMDKRGLVCAEELKKPVKFLPIRPIKKSLAKAAKPAGAITTKSLEGKHPVSLLIEYCTKKHLHPPVFSVCFESGPSHKRVFIFKVEVNGIEYKANAPSPNKKQAKMQAALACLKSLGLVMNDPTTSQ